MPADIRCPLTGEKAQIESGIEEIFNRIYSPACEGYYYTTDGSSVFLNERTKYPELSQGHLNCAQKVLALNLENQIPVLVDSEFDLDLIETLKARHTNLNNRRSIVPVKIESVFLEPADHGAKPLILLSSFANRLSKHRAFSEFRVKPQDRVFARIVDEEELKVALDFLILNRYLVCTEFDRSLLGYGGMFSELNFRITPAGWAENAKANSRSAGNKVFIAAQFRLDDPKEHQVHLQAIDAIKRACKSLGYDADFVSQHHTENISDEILAQIRRSRFVVAEFTNNNRGAYYEAGYARGLQIPVFHLVKNGHTDGPEIEGKKIHFDIAQIMYRKWDNPVDLENELRDWIEVRIGKFGDR